MQTGGGHLKIMLSALSFNQSIIIKNMYLVGCGPRALHSTAPQKRMGQMQRTNVTVYHYYSSSSSSGTITIIRIISLYYYINYSILLF